VVYGVVGAVEALIAGNVVGGLWVDLLPRPVLEVDAAFAVIHTILFTGRHSPNADPLL